MRAWITDRFARNPLHTFTLVSLLLIGIMVITNGYTQSKFFEDALIDREAEIVKQTVVTFALHDALEELRAEDFEDYASATSQQRFEHVLLPLKGIPEVVRLKLYNSDNVIVWSDAKDMVGKHLPKASEHLARVWAGTPSGIFDPTTRPAHAKDPLPSIPLVEFYVPLTVKPSSSDGSEIKAVVAVYRSAKGISDAVRRDVLLLWLVTAFGGVSLFVALFYLFRLIYQRKREAENKLHRLNAEHEQAEMAAIKAKARFYALFDSISDAIFIVGMNGRFIHVNNAACARLGYSREELLELSPADIDTAEYAAKVPERIKTILEQGELVFETAQVGKDGISTLVELNSCVIEFDGKPAILSVARDITERKLMEIELHLAKEAAELALDEQRHLVAMISHEYRSPLAVIDSASQLLGTKLAAENDMVPIIARIRRGVFRLANFLDSCLIEGRMGDGAFTLRCCAIDLHALAASVVENAQLLSEKHLLITELDPDLPLLNADPNLLNILLLNLLGNAIKYSPPGSEVRLCIKHTAQACSFEVIDQGQGIPADELPYVFQKYMRGRAAKSARGVGLGLSLVHKITTLHGGRIEMESREGEGAHATVTLPLNFAKVDSALKCNFCT